MAANKKYYLHFIIVSIGTFVLSYGLSLIENNYFSTNHYWIPLVFFALSTLGINAVLTKSDKNSKEFVFKTLALSMARLLACMVMVLIYSLINKPGALAFSCHFMIQYIIFTVFEIAQLLKYIKQAN